ncbi:hypothetical protein ACXU4B_16630 [Dyella soli]
MKNRPAHRLMAGVFNETFVPVRTRRSDLLSGNRDFRSTNKKAPGFPGALLRKSSTA